MILLIAELRHWQVRHAACPPNKSTYAYEQPRSASRSPAAEQFAFEKANCEAAEQCRPAETKRENYAFSAKRQAVWFETQSVSN